MPIDRGATLKQAEKLLRQGKLDGAIAEYVRLVQDQPRDWPSINALGDLYVRAGNRDRAVEQFTQVADFMFAEGFLPKASALYKKALKVAPDHEHSLLALSEIASRQGLLADARNYLRQLDRLRRDRGDSGGAAEMVIRLALLDEADADARLAGARAAREMGDVAQAVALFKAAAEELMDGGRQRAALDAWSEAAALDPADHGLRRHLAREAVAAGELERARTFLTRESAGTDPDLLLALGRLELAAGHEAGAQAAFMELITVAPDRSGALLDLARALARDGSVDGAFTCTRVLVDDALLSADWDRALGALRVFLEHGAHIPALVMLVELAVDARRDDVMPDAQARLADAYLEAGRGAEARVIAEDLLARNPHSEVHADRLRRALELLGVDDAEATISRYREPAADPGDSLDLDDISFDPVSRNGLTPFLPVSRNGLTPFLPVSRKGSAPFLPAMTDDGSPRATLPPESPEAQTIDLSASFDADDSQGGEEERSESFVIDILEIDLSEALARLGAASPPIPPPIPPPPVTPTEEPVAPPADLESVFQEMRTRVARHQAGGDGAEQYEQALEQLEQNRIPEALATLRAAARMPLYRFRAAARLGRLYLARGEAGEAIEWLERAAEAPPSSPDEGWAVLYDLAAVLERVGESARALAVFMELESDAAAYRDVRARIEHLSRVQAGGS